MTTVKDLREILTSCGYEEEDLQGMKKAELEEAVEEAQGQSAVAVAELSDAETVKDEMYSKVEDVPTKPDIGPGDPDWTQFLLSELHEEELAKSEKGDTVVKVNGLRRLAEKHLGNIVDQNVQVVQCPNPDNQWTATVVVTITILSHYRNGNIEYRMSDAADCSIINSDKKFSKFPTSMATTRAEARVLRKMLKINVVSEEEVLDNDDVDFDNAGSILEPQIHMINAMCNRIGVNAHAFVAMGKRRLENIKDATQREAAQMIQLLNTYQQNLKKIPDDIKEQ